MTHPTLESHADIRNLTHLTTSCTVCNDNLFQQCNAFGKAQHFKTMCLNATSTNNAANGMRKKQPVY